MLKTVCPFQTMLNAHSSVLACARYPNFKAPAIVNIFILTMDQMNMRNIKMVSSVIKPTEISLTQLYGVL